MRRPHYSARLPQCIISHLIEGGYILSTPGAVTRWLVSTELHRSAGPLEHAQFLQCCCAAIMAD